MVYGVEENTISRSSGIKVNDVILMYTTKKELDEPPHSLQHLPSKTSRECGEAFEDKMKQDFETAQKYSQIIFLFIRRL